MRIGIIEDERNVREGIKLILELIDFENQVVFEAGSVQNGIKKLASTKIDILLLDISLGKQTGFELLEQIGEFQFQLIFITAFEQFALDAFKVNALNYLLKPLNPNELLKTLIRARELILQKNIVNENKNNSTTNGRILINTHQEQYIVDISEILFCKSDGAYTKINTKGRVILASKNLKYFQEILPENIFLRTHHSFLVNKYFILTIKGNFVYLEDNIKIPISIRRKPQILEDIRN